MIQPVEAISGVKSQSVVVIGINNITDVVLIWPAGAC